MASDLAAEFDSKSARSLFADFILTWVWSLVKKGYSCLILEEDVPAVPVELRAEAALRQIEAQWEAEKAKAVAANRLPSLERVFWQVCRREVCIGCVFGIVAGLCNTVAKPLLLRSLVSGISEGRPTSELWFFFGCICMAMVCESLAFVGNRHAITDRWFMLFSASFSGLVEAHTLRVATSQIAAAPDLGNLVTSDLARIQGYLLSLTMSPIAATSLISGLVILLYTIGMAGVVGMAPMFLMLGANAFCTKFAKKAEKDNLECTDKRMGIMTQVIHGIRATKFCAWEASFGNIITEARKRECVPLKRVRVFNQGTVQLGRANPYIGAVFAFIYLAVVSRNDPELFRPADIFPALNVFLSLRLPLILLPESVLYMTTIRVSLQRLQRVLSVMPAPCYWTENSATKMDPTGTCIHVEHAAFMWPSLDESKLSKPTSTIEPNSTRMSLRAGEPMIIDELKVPKGCFCAVVGSVGSGKTSLISAILGEMPEMQGAAKATIQISAQRLAVAPQKAFILSGTVRDNIIMGDPFPDEARLQMALQRSELQQDVVILPDGQFTEVGERGVVLSGGQQQRLSIARALYAQSDLFLADDPLSALDPAVADTVFHSLWSYVQEGQGRRTCVVVLNQLGLLPHFDFVVMLAQGRIVASGPPSQLLAQNNMLKKFFASAGYHSNMACTPLQLQQVTETGKQETHAQRQSKHDKLVLQEQKLAGTMSRTVVMRYIKGMGYWWFSFCLLACAVCYGTMAFTDFWLAQWVDAREKKWIGKEDVNDDLYVGIYALGAILFLVLLCTTSYCFAEGGVRSSKNIHAECLNTILHAPVSFFEATPSGRITSRFANDLASVDSVIPRWIDNNIQLVTTIITIAVQIACAVPLMIPILIVCYFCYAWQVKSVNRTIQEVRRYATSAAGPVLTTLSESGNGRLVLRSMGQNDIFVKRFCQQVDDWNRFTYACTSVVTWGQSFVYLLSFVISSTAAVFVIVNRDSYEPSMAALALTYTFIIPYFLNTFCLIFQFLLNSFSSLERLLQYGEGGFVPEEAAWHLSSDPATESWPIKGEVVFEAVSLVYRPGLPKSVDHLTFAVSSAEKVGIVGRSGAGKSSVLVLLFRLYEPTEGRIVVDGVDISRVGLNRLRSAIAVVPQEPLLISGTVRINLDPFGNHADSALINVLNEVQLDSALLDNQTSASTLSHGEKQLLTVGRTLLKPACLRVFDEPTSNIDTATDNIIQRLLRSSASLKASTQITIAHRLQTVIDCNRILVMAAGKLVEVGAPEKLLGDSNSHLARLAEYAGLRVDTEKQGNSLVSI